MSHSEILTGWNTAQAPQDFPFYPSPMTRIKNSSKEVSVCSAVHSGVTRQRISASRTLTVCGNSFSQCVIRGTASSDGQQQLHFQHTLLKTRQLRNCIQAQKMPMLLVLLVQSPTSNPSQIYWHPLLKQWICMCHLWLWRWKREGPD